LVTDSSAYAVLDFSNSDYATALYHVVSLLQSFGQAFASSGYEGTVIFRSPWTTGASPTRVYHLYPLRSIAFSWEEANSGVSDKINAGLDVLSQRETGQTDRDVFFSAPEVKDQSHSRNSAVLKVMPGPDGGSLVDLTDGSEWTVPKESQSRCHFDVGSEVSVRWASEGRPPSVGVSVSGKVCPLDATFVKAW
jgi:hypothetical protein